MQRNHFHLNVTSTCKGANPQRHQCIVWCQKPERLYLGFSSKCQGSDCRPYPCSFWRTLSISWFGVKGWGWGIVSVFITRGNVWSDNHHARRSKAERGVICRRLLQAHFWWADPEVSWGGKEFSSRMALPAWAHVGLHSKSKILVSSF